MKHILAALLLVAAPASGTEFTVLLPEQSSVTFVSRQMNVPVEGSFRKFTAQISVDPAKPETGKARIEIDLASIDTGTTEVDEEAASSAWFDTRNHPFARFTSGGIVRTGEGKYQATGKMTIKGKTLGVTAPFTLKRSGGTLLIDGSFPLKRLDFNIGSGIWADTTTVDNEVQIKFRLAVAAKQ